MSEWIAENIGWMYWTWPSGLAIGGLFVAIAFMTIWDVASPTPFRKGFLPIQTTRGDRFFIGVISTIAIFLFWLAFVGGKLLLIPLLISIAWFAIQGRWG